jgi:hypothetical protein
MPIPKPSKGQDEKEFISACIREIIDEYDAPGQAYAVCKGEYDKENMTEEFADYAWDDCMLDQTERYGDEETAAKICGAIKAANMSSEEFATLPTVDCMERHKSDGYTEQYAKWACSGRPKNDGQQGGVVAAMSEQFSRKKFEYPPSHKEDMTSFMGRCMSDIAVKESKPYRPSRAGFCYEQYQNRYLSNIGKKWK